jgi:hypothetical protein
MDAIFKVLELLIAGYFVLAALNGAIYAKSGVWGRAFRRTDRSLHDWSAIAACTLVPMTLMFWF